MENILEKDKLEIFNRVLISLHAIVKRGMLYSFDHPSVIEATAGFLQTINRWFELEPSLGIKFAFDHLTLDGYTLKEKAKVYGEIAEMFYTKGVIGLVISRGVTGDEISALLELLRKDVKLIRESGGILKNMPKTEHLLIKELDYSRLLGSARDKVTAEEARAWEEYIKTAEKARKGGIGQDAQQFLVDFLSSGDRGASMINNMFKLAAGEKDKAVMVKKFYYATSSLCEQLKEEGSVDRADIEKKLASTIMNLEPGIISGLLEEAINDQSGRGLFSSLTEGLTEGELARFIESFMRDKGTFMEHHLKVLDKLLSEEEKMKNVVSIITDKFIGSKDSAVASLQENLRELFKVHPNNKFMSEMYKFTVQHLVDGKNEPVIGTENFERLKKAVMTALEPGSLAREKMTLISNLLWLEHDAADFTKLCAMQLAAMPAVLNAEGVGTLKNAVTLFTEKLRPEQAKDPEINREARQAVSRMLDRETMEKLVSFIPFLPPHGVDEVLYMISKSNVRVQDMLLDTFLSCDDEAGSAKVIKVIEKTGWGVFSALMAVADTVEPSRMGRFLRAMDSLSQGEERDVIKKLSSHWDKSVREEALGRYIPTERAEMDALLKRFKLEKDRAVAVKIMSVLVKTRNGHIIKELFGYLQRKLFAGELYIKLIEMAGYYKVKESVPHLEAAFGRRFFIHTAGTDRMQVASLMSLNRVDRASAEKLASASTPARPRIRAACQAVLSMKEIERTDGAG